MAIEDLNGELLLPSREDLVTKYKRDHQLRNEDADVTDGSMVDLDARTLADQLVPLYSNSRLIADAVNEDAATGERLDRVGARYGVTRGKATGATGYVQVSTSSSGGTIQVGQELKNRATGLKYEAAEEKYVTNGQTIRVRGVDKGPNTDVDAGVVLQWTAPPGGIGTNATVVEQTGGVGLSGGADVESDERYLLRIQDRRRNPSADGNDARIAEVVGQTPDVPVEQVFTYPTPFGPGSHAFTFTVLASKLGASRKPTPAQLAAALAQLEGELAGDDSYFAMEIDEVEKQVVLKLDWDSSVPGWTDSIPWPPYYATGAGAGAPGAIVTGTVTSSTVFQLVTDNGDYTGVIQPTVGQTIGFFDRTNGKWSRKKIASVTGAGPWNITCETANNASDTTFVPADGGEARPSPWSESLPEIVNAVLGYMATLGPGEIFASFVDERRQKRNPRSTKQWPQAIGGGLITKLLAVPAVFDAVTQEGGAELPPVGTPGVQVRMIEMTDLAVFPKS